MVAARYRDDTSTLMLRLLWCKRTPEELAKEENRQDDRAGLGKLGVSTARHSPLPFADDKLVALLSHTNRPKSRFYHVRDPLFENYDI